MRLREPFQGYKLSSGHLLFHVAYLFGSYIARVHVLKDEHFDSTSLDILYQINLAHFLVPCFNIMSFLSSENGYNVISKTLDIVSIFQYQATIFYAQYYQMNSPQETKLTGINAWFVIEILSFYGYILGAVFFILEH